MNHNLDRDSLLEIASYLEAEDLCKYVEVHKDTLGWSDILQRKYNIRIEDASQKDYDLLSKYESLKQGEDATRYILSELAPEIQLEDVIIPIEESLNEEEDRARVEPKLWLLNSSAYDWGKLDGLYTQAKTASGAAYALIKKVPGFREELLSILEEIYLELGDVRGAREILIGSRRVIDLLKRSEGNPPSFLPSLEELEEILSEAEEDSILDNPKEYIDKFTDLLEGELDYTSNRPLFSSYEQLLFIE